MLVHKDASLSTAELAVYTTPPLPAVNVFIKRTASPDASIADDSNCPDAAGGYQPPKVVSSRKLLKHLLHARTEACAALSAHLMDNKAMLAFLLDRDSRILD